MIDFPLSGQIDCDDRKVEVDCDLKLPSDVPIQIARALANQNDDVLCVGEALAKGSLHGGLGSPICQLGTQVVGIRKIERDRRQRVPALHAAISPDVIVGVEYDVGFISVGHIASSVTQNIAMRGV